MTSPYLKITPLVVDQSGKETTVNNVWSRVEEATQAQVDIDFVGGNVTLTEDQQTLNFVFNCINLAADRTLTLLNEIDSNGANTACRFFAVRNDTNFIVTVAVSGGTDTVTVLPNEFTICYSDGTDAYRADGGITFGAFIPGQPIGSSVIFQYVAEHPFELFAALDGAQAFARTAALASTTYDLQRNEVSIGSMVFAASAQTATFTFTTDTAFAITDRFAVVAPATPDANLADHSFSVNGTRR